jgi:hypothetical protein
MDSPTPPQPMTAELLPTPLHSTRTTLPEHGHPGRTLPGGVNLTAEDAAADKLLYAAQLEMLIRRGFLDPIPDYDVAEAVRCRATYFPPRAEGE